MKLKQKEAKMAKWNKVGSLRKSQKGGLYIKLDADVTLTKGTSLSLQDPRKSIQGLADQGKITSDQASERLSKLPEYIKYDVFLVEEQ